jgi:hypothetical protein
LSRLLVLLTTALLLVMPITEHLFAWDKFLRGGPDVEFNLLAWLLFAAMVVLSMNGNMLRPSVMQPGMMQPESAARAASPGSISGTLTRSVIAQGSACTRSRERWLSESESVLDSGSRSRAPMRI